MVRRQRPYDALGGASFDEQNAPRFAPSGLKASTPSIVSVVAALRAARLRSSSIENLSRANERT
jgi:hypothetical protein